MAFMVQENERPAFEEFREVMKDLVTDEHMLLRFLRARSLNVQKAEQMLRKSMEWRQKNDIDSIKKYEIPSALTKDFKIYYSGADSEKRPVFTMPMGRWDGKKILNMGYKDEACRFMHKTLEIIMEKCKKSGVSQSHVIFDFAELTFWKVAHWDSIETVIRVVIDFEANFPESLYRAYFVNAPSVFWQAFKAVKPILDINTLGKIQILDLDKTKCSEHLLQYIPKESLPMDYGGTGICKDFYPTFAES